jgi:hypothetical protein
VTPWRGRAAADLVLPPRAEIGASSRQVAGSLLQRMRSTKHDTEE